MMEESHDAHIAAYFVDHFSFSIHHLVVEKGLLRVGLKRERSQKGQRGMWFPSSGKV